MTERGIESYTLQMSVRRGSRALVGAASLLVAFASWGAAGSASASTRRCWGYMMLEDCTPAFNQVWAADSRPTFGALCELCPNPPGPCTRMAPDPGSFVMEVEADRHGGSQSGYFERVGPTCGEHELFRYLGPLVPGKSHRIFLGANSGAQPTPTFDVAPSSGVESGAEPTAEPTAMEPGAAEPSVDTAASSDDASADAAPSTAQGGGCDCALNPPPSSHSPPIALPIVLTLLTLTRRRRPHRRQIVASKEAHR